MKKQDMQGKHEGRPSRGDQDGTQSPRSEQELKSMLNAMAREDKRELIAALKDWLHE